MGEIESNTIDLIFFSPPYNIGTDYDNFRDNLKLEDYFFFMNQVIKECKRVLKKGGKIIIEIADSIVSNKRYAQLAGLIQKFALNEGLFLETRHINFVRTKNGIELPEYGLNENYISSSNAHSNCHQILVFSNERTKFKEGNILYIDYNASKEHPCAEPERMIRFILDNYFKKGMRVLDPFMGTANTGEAIIKRKGFFFGYEIVKKFFDVAKEKLEKASSE